MKVIYGNKVWEWDGEILTNSETDETRRVSIGKPMSKEDILSKMEITNAKFASNMQTLQMQLKMLEEA